MPWEYTESLISTLIIFHLLNELLSAYGGGFHLHEMKFPEFIINFGIERPTYTKVKQMTESNFWLCEGVN